MKILGIDPGTNILGYAIVQGQGSSVELIASGVLDLRKEKDDYRKLERIFSTVTEIINSYQPDECAVESPFYGKNAQSMLKLGRAQGVAIAAAMSKGLPVTEYAPRKVKIAVTGNGNASKDQVARMVETILHIKTTDKKADETDAMAIALCHFFNYKSRTAGQYSSWKDFARKNNLL